MTGKPYGDKILVEFVPHESAGLGFAVEASHRNATGFGVVADASASAKDAPAVDELVCFDAAKAVELKSGAKYYRLVPLSAIHWVAPAPAKPDPEPAPAVPAPAPSPAPAVAPLAPPAPAPGGFKPA